MLRRILMGTAAGAVGTVALNVTTYADMAVRGRPASQMPSEMAGLLAEKAGISLSSGGEGSDDSKAENRKGGLGALSGFVVGLGVGTAYGVVRSQARDVPMPIAALGLGLTAMAGSDVPLTVLGLTNPVKWGAAGWLSDLIPHMAYGLVTAASYNAFVNEKGH